MPINSKRVLNRVGARELTPEETRNMWEDDVRTTTVCSFNPITLQPDGDPGEC
jgi:hypothetical protein